MTDAHDIAHAYLETWNETDPVRRAALLERAWTADAAYADPLADVAGRAAIDAMIGGVQARFPGFRFALKGSADGHGAYARFSWTLGPDGQEPPIEGSDVITLSGGRIARVIGFLDKVPAAA